MNQTRRFLLQLLVGLSAAAIGLVRRVFMFAAPPAQAPSWRWWISSSRMAMGQVQSSWAYRTTCMPGQAHIPSSPDRSQQKRPCTCGPLQDLEPRWKDLRSWNHIGGNMNPTDGRVGYQYSHVRGVGGTTLHYTGSAHRLHPQTMNMRPRFGVAADWPLSYAELDRITARPSV